MTRRAILVALSVALYCSAAAHVYSQQAVNQTGSIAIASQSLQFQQALSSLHAANVAAIGNLSFQSPPQAQLGLAQNVARLQPQLTITPITEITVPADASDALVNLYAAKVTLLNDEIARYNAASISSAAKGAPEKSADADAVLQSAATLAAQQPSAPVTLPQASALPSNASPALQAFLSQRNQLMQEELQVYNQYISADKATREAALDAWQKANAARFDQLRQTAQNLSPSQN